MNLEAVYKAIRRRVETVGAATTAKLLLRAVSDRLLRREECLFYANLLTYALAPQELATDITVMQFTSIEDLPPKHHESLAAYAGEGYVRQARRRLANNWALFVATMEDNLAGGGWAITNQSGFQSKIVPLLEGDVSLIDFFTLPKFRGKNVYPYLLSSALTEFKKLGFIRAYGYTTEWNFAANQGIVKAGFRYSMKYEAYLIGRNELVIWKAARETNRHSVDTKRPA